MPSTGNTKLKLLYLTEIFEKYTDDEHSLSAHEICDLLEERGVTAERKSIYKDIAVLKEYGYDIILCNQTGAKGFFLGSRKFEEAELRLLMDAVQAANFISPKKTNALLTKIESFTSQYRAQRLHSQVYVDNRPKCSNEELYYTISDLDNAIQNKVKVTFTYSRRKITEEFRTQREEKTFTVSPYAMIWSDDHYYLVCNNEKYDNLMHLRIDKIKKVTVTDEPRRDFSLVSDYKKRFDSADYASKLFNMFSGEPKPIELICKNDFIEVMLDRFGEKAKIQKYDEDSFVIKTNVAVSDGLAAWIMQYGSKVKVKSPNDLAYLVKQRAKEILEQYNEE